MVRRSLKPYVLSVSLMGLSASVWVATTGTLTPVHAAPSGFWVFSVLLLIGEVFPVAVPHRGGEPDEVTTSTMFAFAILIRYGTAAAVLSQIVVSAIADLAFRKSLWKIWFNVSQYLVSLAVAGWLYRSLGGGTAFSVADLGPYAAAALAFFVLNTTLPDAAIALSGGDRVGRYVVGDLVFQAHVAGPLLSLSPVVVVVAERNLWLIPLVVAPVVAVYRGARLNAENTRLVAKLQASLDRMTELNRMKDDFVAVVSHELRTPLTSIQGYIKTLLQLSPDLAEGQRTSFLEAADRQGDRLSRLVEQLLVVARLESHVEPLVVSRVSLTRLAAVAVDELRSRARGHVFDVRIDPAVDEIETDEGKIHQILSNLLENAIKYSPPDTRVTITAEPGLHGVLVTIADEGPGVPEEAHERIFERFFQVDSSATRRVGGTGLGLYISRKMADAAGARLWLASSDASGSEFSLFLPERPPEAEDSGAPVAAPRDQSMTASV